ncbi:MAG: hypothetical protein RR768_09765, partial [Clostridium sp.]
MLKLAFQADMLLQVIIQKLQYKVETAIRNNYAQQKTVYAAGKSNILNFIAWSNLRQYQFYIEIS